MQPKRSLCLIGVFVLTLGFASYIVIDGRAQETTNFVDPQFREELLADLDGFDDELSSLRAVTEERLSQPAKFARACLLLALEFIREGNTLGQATAASGAKGATEVALFILKGFEVASNVFAQKCLDIQDPTTGAGGKFVGRGEEESPRFDIQTIEDIKADVEVIFKEDIVTRVDEGIRTGLIKGEELIDEIHIELNAMFFKLFGLNEKLIQAQIFINSCVEQVLAALAAVELSAKNPGLGVEPNLRKAASALKRCVRDLNRLIRIEKSIFLEIKDIVLEKVLFIKKLFFLVPLPVPGPTPPPIGLSLDSSTVSVQVFNLNGRLVFDSAASGSLSWNHVGANGVYFYVVTGRAADGRLTRSVKKVVVLK